MITNRTAGITLFSIPFYLVFGASSHFSMFPAVLAAAVASAGSVTFVVLALRRVVTTRQALLAGFVLGLGTATWSVTRRHPR